MSEREFEMEKKPVIERGTNNSQPLTTADMAGVAAAAARRKPISDQIDIDRERGAVDYQSAAGSQPEEARRRCLSKARSIISVLAGEQSRPDSSITRVEQ